MKFKVDRRIYSDSCIANTLYWLCEKYSCSRNLLNENEELVTIEPLNVNIPDVFIKNEFWRNLNDNKLRDTIKQETKDIRTILFVKAFSECDDITEEDLNEI